MVLRLLRYRCFTRNCCSDRWLMLEAGQRVPLPCWLPPPRPAGHRALPGQAPLPRPGRGRDDRPCLCRCNGGRTGPLALSASPVRSELVREPRNPDEV